MKIGVFGGTFDPIHRGHVEPVRKVRERLALDRVLFLPTAIPPHKDGPRGAAPLQRYAMVELALLDEPDLHASDLEMGPGPSYTVETLETLRRERPDDDVLLLLGADSFVQLPSWRRWRDILRQVELAVMVRPGWRLEEHEEDFEDEQRQALADGRVHLVENPPVDVSSSEIRRTLGRGEIPADDALHPRVLRYVQKYGLYGPETPTP